jgi:hypothetical protein
LSSNVSDVFPKVLKLSSAVSECKLLPAALVRGASCVDGGEYAHGGGLLPGAYSRPLFGST